MFSQLDLKFMLDYSLPLLLYYHHYHNHQYQKTKRRLIKTFLKQYKMYLRVSASYKMQINFT